MNPERIWLELLLEARNVAHTLKVGIQVDPVAHYLAERVCDLADGLGEGAFPAAVPAGHGHV